MKFVFTFAVAAQAYSDERFSGVPIGQLLSLNDDEKKPNPLQVAREEYQKPDFPWISNEQKQVNGMANGGMWEIPDNGMHEGYGEGRYSEGTAYSPIYPGNAEHLVPGFPRVGETPGPKFDIPETAKDWVQPWQKEIKAL